MVAKATLRSEPGTVTVIGYPLASTLSERGGVTRAVCDVAPDGTVGRIEERRGLVDRHGVAGIVDSDGVPHEPDRLVSMNLVSMPAGAPALLRRCLERFVARHPHGAGELSLAEAMEELRSAGDLRVRLVPAAGGWMGITHPADLADVRAALVART
jgi:hypothetical protein